jgi:hypothetical protein
MTRETGGLKDKGEEDLVMLVVEEKKYQLQPYLC